MRFPLRITENFLLEPIMHTLGVRADTAFVELSGTDLTVSMGRWFHHVFPLSAIASQAPSDWPWWGGLGVRLGHHGVGIVAAMDGIVNLTFHKPVNVNVLVMNVNAEQIWLSLEDPAGFMAAVSQKTGLAPGPHKPF